MNTAFRRILVLTPLAGVASGLGAALVLPGFDVDAATVAACFGFLAVYVLGALALIGRGRIAPRALPFKNVTPVRVNNPIRPVQKPLDLDSRLAA